MNTGGTPAAPPCLVLSISNPSLDGGYPVRWMSCVVERDWAGRHYILPTKTTSIERD